MDRMLYIAGTGAAELLNAQAIHANNLANANTVGFHADKPIFEGESVLGDGHDSRTFSKLVDIQTDMFPGSIQETGRELDVAVTSVKGWIAVEDDQGNEAYTRVGTLQFNETGLLTTTSGHPVIGSGGAITVPTASKVEIGVDGSITVRGQGQNAASLINVDRIKLVSAEPVDLVKGTDGLFRKREGGELEADISVQVTSGAVISSNVNPISELISIMDIARNIEVEVKLMKAAEENQADASRIMSIS